MYEIIKIIWLKAYLQMVMNFIESLSNYKIVGIYAKIFILLRLCNIKQKTWNCKYNLMCDRYYRNSKWEKYVLVKTIF